MILEFKTSYFAIYSFILQFWITVQVLADIIYQVALELEKNQRLRRRVLLDIETETVARGKGQTMLK